MGYIPTIWQDRNVAAPRDFVATKGGGGAISSGDTLTMTPNPGIITATGVAPNKSRMDNIDEGVESLYNGDGLYVVTTGLANTYVATFTTAYTSYVTGLTLRVKFNLENTTTSTINVDTLGAKIIKKVTGAGIEVLEVGDIVADGVYIVVYNGTDFILANQFKVKPMNEIFTTSGTFNAPFTGNYKVTVVGGGGGGSRATTPNFFAGGGGVAGIAEKIVTLTKGDAVTVTVGVGGAIQVTPSIAGNNGSASSFGGYCTGNGGIGGGVAGVVQGSGGVGGTGVDGIPTGNFVGITGETGNFSFNALPSGFLNFYDTPNTLFGVSYGYGAGAVNGNPANGLAGGDGVVVVEWEEG